MNHLAHLVLADGDDGLRLGALLGDHIKGRQALAVMPGTWARGVLLHRRIDSWSDQHPALRCFISGLSAPWRRYAGIISDVLFDTMLSRHWSRFGPVPLGRFAQSVDCLLEQHSPSLPPRLAGFAGWARENRLWQRYQDRKMLERIFLGLARRHEKQSPLARGLELLDRHDSRIEAVFLELFPELQERAAAWRASQPSSALVEHVQHVNN